MKAKVEKPSLGWRAWGKTMPSSPKVVLAEDFSILIRGPRRVRVARGRVKLLN